MEITVKELLEGKATIIRNKEYYETRKYVQPFLDKMKAFTNEFRVFVKVPDQMTTGGNNPDITFNRVLVQAILPKEHDIDDYKEVICFTYGIDVRKPVAKFYRGYIHKTTNVFMAFNPMWMTAQVLEPEEPITYNIKSLMESANDFEEKLNKLKNTTIKIEDSIINSMLGGWIRNGIKQEYSSEFGKIKLSKSMPIDAYESVFVDTDSEYYCNADVTEVDLLTLHGAFTQIIEDDKKDFMNKFEKTLLVNNLIK